MTSGCKSCPLQVQVKSFKRNRDQNTVTVVFTCYYESEYEEFQSSCDMLDNVTNEQYAQQALKQCQQDIKRWIKRVTITPSIVGAVMYVDNTFINDDSSVDDEKSNKRTRDTFETESLS